LLYHSGRFLRGSCEHNWNVSGLESAKRSQYGFGRDPRMIMAGSDIFTAADDQEALETEPAQAM